MRSKVAVCGLLSFIIGIISVETAVAGCPGNPGALGTSRTIAVDPTEHPRLGVFQYQESLPLNDREVVLTFDDGPLPPYTNYILDVLANECVQATFFMVGQMARTYPRLVRRAHADGHTLANHSQNHPLTFHKITVDQAAREIEDGFTSIRAALGDPNGVAHFFRIPGLLRQTSVEAYLASRGYMTWSVDLAGDDWTRISAGEIVSRALSRLEARGKGILLLHDIQPATAVGLPALLRGLKERGFKVVHVVQAGPDHPKTATLPEQWIVARAVRAKTPSIWPRIKWGGLYLPEPVLEVPDTNNFGISDATGLYEHLPAPTLGSRGIGAAPPTSWSRGVRLVGALSGEVMPAPDAANFRYSPRLKPRRPVVRRKPDATKDAMSASAAASKGAATTSTAASTPKGVPNPPPQDSSAPRPPRSVGPQSQLPNPNASRPQQVGMR